MFGSYYEDSQLQPISGLGTTEGSMEAARRLARAAPASVRYTVWATQNGETHFRDNVEGQDFLISPAPITALAQAQAAAGGHPISLVGVLFNRPISLKLGEDLFKGTPYEPLKSQVLYRQDDPKPVPTPVFVVWGILRAHDDVNASYQNLAANASKLQGIIVTGYGTSVLPKPRLRPGLSAEQAILSNAPVYTSKNQPLYVYSPTSQKAAEVAKVAALKKQQTKGLGAVARSGSGSGKSLTSAQLSKLAAMKRSTNGLGADEPPLDGKTIALGVGLGVIGFVIFRQVWEGIAV